MADRLERITELLMLLLDSSQALTFEEIVDRTELYRNVSEASRKAFERDKSGLRGLGVVITTATEEGDRGATRYRVRPQDYFLPDLDLSEGRTALAASGRRRGAPRRCLGRPSGAQARRITVVAGAGGCDRADARGPARSTRRDR